MKKKIFSLLTLLLLLSACGSDNTGENAARMLSDARVALRYKHYAEAKDSILFAMANPTPEIMPDLAKEAGARIIGTGRSDFPNQVNNVVAFPGIFRGALECRATAITEEMKLAAANAIASLVEDSQLSDDFILPEAFDPRVAVAVANAIKACK